jgi:glycosyltransferase involved in cell wall biosynthesis
VSNTVICHIITTFHEKAASVRRTLYICTALIGQGAIVYLIVGADSSLSLIDKCRKQGIRVIQIHSLVKYVQPFNDLRALLTLIRLLRRIRCDIVHTHLSKSGIIARLAARMTKVKIICHTVHGPTAVHEEHGFMRRKIYVNLERFFANLSTVMIMVGKELQEKYMQLGIGDGAKDRVIYTGRDFSKYLAVKQRPVEDKVTLRKTLGIETDDIVIGYVGRIAPFKGHEYAIAICERLKTKHKNIKFIFIGSSHIPSRMMYEQMIKQNVRDRSLDDIISFMDYTYDIEKYYSIFDIFIFPSLSEGLPNVILEAAVMELPIVAFDCGGVKEILGENEYIVKTKDTEKFAEKLEDLIQSKEKRKEAVAKRKYAVEQLLSIWSLEKMIRDESDLYKELL